MVNITNGKIVLENKKIEKFLNKGRVFINGTGRDGNVAAAFIEFADNGDEIWEISRHGFNQLLSLISGYYRVGDVAYLDGQTGKSYNTSVDALVGDYAILVEETLQDGPAVLYLNGFLQGNIETVEEFETLAKMIWHRDGRIYSYKLKQKGRIMLSGKI